MACKSLRNPSRTRPNNEKTIKETRRSIPKVADIVIGVHKTHEIVGWKEMRRIAFGCCTLRMYS